MYPSKCTIEPYLTKLVIHSTWSWSCGGGVTGCPPIRTPLANGSFFN